MTHDSPFYQEGSRTGIFYSESWALAHYLLNNEAAQKAGLFNAYMKALDADPDGLAAAKTAFGDLTTFTSAFLTYARQYRFHHWMFHRSAAVRASDFTEAPVDPATALLIRAEFLDAMGLNQGAREVLRSLESAPPPGPAYQVALGMNALGRNEPLEAERAFREAIRLGTRDFRAPAYLASLLRDHAGPQESRDASRALLEQALTLHPDVPWVHSLLGLTLAQDAAKATQAVQEARMAVDLEPIQGYLRANLGVTYMTLGQEAEAQSVGESLARQARDTQDRTLASQYALQLDQWLANRKARAEAIKRAEAHEPVRNATPPTPPTLPRPTKNKNHGLPAQEAVLNPLHFSLPDRLAPLGYEILGLVSRSNLKAAQAKVRKALAQARTPEERQALGTLSSQLRALRPAVNK